ncbi:MAG: HAMP domain-containing sensor histidine kinase [Clostridia bacterium]
MKQKITTRIVISFCALILFTLAMQIVFNLFFATSYYIDKSKAQLEELFDKIKTNYTDDAQTLYELTQEEDYVQGFSIQIYSEDGLVYTSRNTSTNLVPVRDDILATGNKLSSYTASMFSDAPQAGIFDPMDGTTEIISLQGQFDFEGETRYVSITYAVESIENSVEIFTNSSLIISVLVLIVGTILIIFISKGLTKPIQEIELVSQKLADLDFSYRANENNSVVELSSLATNINSMSTQLQTSMGKLQIANDKLKKDVDYQKNLDSMRKQFVANVSHEMKTPIALLQLYCENLKGDIDGIDVRDYCDVIIEESERLNKIVGDMLNISSMENGLTKMSFEKFDLSSSCQELMENLEPLLSDFEVEVIISPDITMFGDKNHIQEAMRNYISNAISHTKTGGKIKVSLSKSFDKINFSVYNEGEKIEENELEIIWDSFYKSDKSRTRVSGSNAGLGLYIVKIITQNHDGSYACKNIKDGVEFSMSFDLVLN